MDGAALPAWDYQPFPKRTLCTLSSTINPSLNKLVQSRRVNIGLSLILRTNTLLGPIRMQIYIYIYILLANSQQSAPPLQNFYNGSKSSPAIAETAV